jgi:hypothetical protein
MATSVKNSPIERLFMKRTMKWMWDHEVQVLDEKGRTVKGRELSEEPVADGKKVRVAHYTPKEK